MELVDRPNLNALQARLLQLALNEPDLVVEGCDHEDVRESNTSRWLPFIIARIDPFTTTYRLNNGRNLVGLFGAGSCIAAVIHRDWDDAWRDLF